jgi:hypothetical protein
VPSGPVGVARFRYRSILLIHGLALTFAIWAFSLTLTIPAVIDGSIFKAPYLTITPPQAGLPTSIKTSERWESQSSTLHNAPRLEKS